MARLAGLHAEGVADLESYFLGVADECDRIIVLLRDRLCFSNRENMACEHQLCYGIRDLLEKVQEQGQEPAKPVLPTLRARIMQERFGENK